MLSIWNQTLLTFWRSQVEVIYWNTVIILNSFMKGTFVQWFVKVKLQINMKKWLINKESVITFFPFFFFTLFITV